MRPEQTISASVGIKVAGQQELPDREPSMAQMEFLRVEIHSYKSNIDNWYRKTILGVRQIWPILFTQNVPALASWQGAVCSWRRWNFSARSFSPAVWVVGTQLEARAEQATSSSSCRLTSFARRRSQHYNYTQWLLTFHGDNCQLFWKDMNWFVLASVSP